jgi:phosphatidylserine/phosphatidylglycerophosphate/cardiolipin synthase-like enzyme
VVPRRHVELITERPVERFLLRLFLRDTEFRTLCVVSPFISSMASSRFTLIDLRLKVERERIPTYVITREPAEAYQEEAMTVLSGCPWVEIRYNASVHAKVYVALSAREVDSFALFGSGNLTSASFESNIEVAMMLYCEGMGRLLLHELHYWVCGRLRTLRESVLVQRIKAERK